MQFTPLSHQAFDRLQAEHEGGWLSEVYTLPQGFEAMAGMRSIVVFGREGTGKTALRRALQQFVQASHPPSVLLVEWLPSVLFVGENPREGIQVWLHQIFHDCAFALLRFLGRYPETFRNVASWVQETLIWFIHGFLKGERTILLSRLEEECVPEGITLLGEVFSRPAREILPSNASETRIIAELADITRRLGLNGIWVVVDGLTPWVELDADVLGQMFEMMLSTLAWFEEQGFALKLILPSSIEPQLASSGGVLRRRLGVHHLEWSLDEFVMIVENRLAKTMGKATFTLADLCDESDLVLDWLQNHGEDTPRGWLELIRPLVDAYLAQGMGRPLRREEWTTITGFGASKLRVDLETDRVFIGNREITGIQPAMLKLLRYLYQHRPRLCTRSELYYRAYREIPKEPRKGDEKWEAPNSWRGNLDTMIWRLREQIEPDLKNPIYIITEVRKGIRLGNTW